MVTNFVRLCEVCMKAEARMQQRCLRAIFKLLYTCSIAVGELIGLAAGDLSVLLLPWRLVHIL